MSVDRTRAIRGWLTLIRHSGRDSKFAVHSLAADALARATWTAWPAVMMVGNDVPVVGFTRLSHDDSGRVWAHVGRCCVRSAGTSDAVGPSRAAATTRRRSP